MNYVLVFAFCTAGILGVLNGINSIRQVRSGLKPGVKESKNIFSFFIFDRY